MKDEVTDLQTLDEDVVENEKNLFLVDVHHGKLDSGLM